MSANRMKMTRNIRSTRLFPGDHTKVRLTLTNRTGLALPWAYIDVGNPEGFTINPGRYFAKTFRRHESHDIDYEMQAVSRGVLSLPPPTVEIGDAFGLKSIRLENETPEIEMLVYPRIHPLPHLNLSTETLSDGYGQLSRGLPDPLKVIGTRAYIPGESLKHVHWKATAHLGALQVKTMEAARQIDLSVIVDLSRDAASSWTHTHLPEMSIEAAASIVFDSAGLGGIFELIVIGGGKELGRTGRGRGEAHLMSALEMLARVDAGSTNRSLQEVVFDVSHELRRPSTLVIVTPRLGEAVQSVTSTKRQGFRRVVIIHVINASDRQGEIQLPRGISCFPVSSFRDISMIGQSRSGRR